MTVVLMETKWVGKLVGWVGKMVAQLGAQSDMKTDNYSVG